MVWIRYRNYIYIIIGLSLVIAAILIWQQKQVREPLPDELFTPDEYLLKSTEAANVLKCQDAARHLERAVALEGAIEFRHLVTVYTCFVNTVQHDQAEGVFAQLAENLPTPFLQGIAVLFQASHFYILDCESSLSHAQKAVAILENVQQEEMGRRGALSEAHRVLGSAFLCLERFDEAIVAYRQSLVLASNNRSAMNAIGVVYNRMGRYDLAERYFLESLALDSEFWKPLFNLALLEYYAGLLDPSQAAAYAERFLAAYDRLGHLPGPGRLPEFYYVLYGRYILARSYEQMGDIRAIKIYEKAQAMVDEHRDRLMAIEGAGEWPWQIENLLQRSKRTLQR